MLTLFVLCVASAKDLNQTRADPINGTFDISQIMASKYTQCTNPTGPEVRCDMVPDEYQDCDPPIFKSKNEIINTNQTLDYLETCYIEELGGQYYELVKQVYVTCRILDDIDCCGDRSFYRKVPCIRHKLSQENGKCKYSYPITVILSIFLGLVGGDRFYLDHTASGIGKLFTLGGLGVWWLVDIVLLLTGQLMPPEGYNWCNNY